MELLIRLQPLLILGMTAVFSLVIWALRKSMVTKEDHAKATHKTDEKITALDRRVLTLENTVESVPSREELGQLSVALERMRGDMKAFQADLEGFRELFERAERQLGLVQAHLLEREKVR